MKKIIALGAVLILFFCCSSDDDDSNSTPNTETLESKILGTWSYTAVQVNGADTGLEEGDCMLENTITYNANNQINYEVHNEDSTGNCLQQSFTDAWFIDGENSYISVQPGDDVMVEFFVEFIDENSILLSYNDDDPDIVITLVKL